MNEAGLCVALLADNETPEPGSREAELTERYLVAKDWL